LGDRDAGNLPSAVSRPPVNDSKEIRSTHISEGCQRYCVEAISKVHVVPELCKAERAKSVRVNQELEKQQERPLLGSSENRNSRNFFCIKNPRSRPSIAGAEIENVYELLSSLGTLMARMEEGTLTETTAYAAPRLYAIKRFSVGASRLSGGETKSRLVSHNRLARERLATAFARLFRKTPMGGENSQTVHVSYTRRAGWVCRPDREGLVREAASLPTQRGRRLVAQKKFRSAGKVKRAK
jgi:hypothetical protein